MVCQFIGAQAMIDVSKHGGKNPLVETALAISIFGDRTPEQAEQDRIRGPVVARHVQDDARFQQVAADPEAGVEASNAAGSYEAFLAMMGGPPPMPGRGG